MTATVANAKQGLTRVPTYAELIKEIDKERIKTTEIRKVFDRNAWYFHDSPLNTAPDLNNGNIHPADLQQQNFKRMAQEATVPEETFFDAVSMDEMGEMRDDAVDLYEKSFEREQEMREEEERKMAEQVSISHKADYYDMNKTVLDGVDMKQEPASFSAGIEPQEPEVKKSMAEQLKEQVKSKGKKVAKNIVKQAVKQIAEARGGPIGGMIAEKLADVVMPETEEKKEPIPKAKPIKKDMTLVKAKKPEKSKIEAKVKAEPKRRVSKKRPLESVSVEPSSSSNALPTAPALPAPTIPEAPPAPPPTPAQKPKPSPKIKAKAKASPAQKPTSSSSNLPPEAPSVKKTISKDYKDAIAPSKIGIQVLRETFMDAHHKNIIGLMVFREYEEIFNEWKSAKKDEKKQKLDEMRKYYKEKLYPILKAKKKESK